MNKWNSVSETGWYKQVKWQRCRQTILQRDGFLCRMCLCYGLVTPATLVHHIKPLTLDNCLDDSISCNPENLVSLCDDCHNRIHNRTQHTRYKIDDEGNIIDCVEDISGDDLMKKFLK